MEPSGPRPPKPNAYGVDTVSVSSRYKIREKDKISAGVAPVEGAPAKAPESSPAPLVISDEVARILQRDFPEVDYGKQIARARNWCVLRGQAIRNVLLLSPKVVRQRRQAPKKRQAPNERPETGAPDAAPLPARYGFQGAHGSRA